MKKISRLTALLMALLLIFSSIALATETLGVISTADLDSDSYATLLSAAEQSKVEAPECSCNYDAPENLVNHQDECQRKQFVKSLFDGKNAHAIYAQWYKYDEALRTDLLNMLETYNPSVFQELQQLIGSVTPEEVAEAFDRLKAATTRNEFEEIYNTLSDEIKAQFSEEQLAELESIRESLDSVFEENAEYNGCTIDVNVNGDIPVNAEVNADPITGEDLVNVGFSFGHKYMLFALDIAIYDENGEEWQPDPEKPITISFNVSDLGVEDGSKVSVFHKHENEEPTCTSGLTVENGCVNYKASKLSPIALAAEDYPLRGDAYDSSKLVYWDVAVPTGNSFPSHEGYTGNDEARVASVELNNKPVVLGNSNGKSPGQWKVNDKTASSLSSYYPGTSYGSANDTSELIIKAAPGYYVTNVTVACTASQPAKWNGLVVMSNAYNCGTWKSGNEYTKALTYEQTGEVTIDLPSLAFCHMSNRMETIWIDNGGLIPEAGGESQYFILIEVAPVPSPLYVEYQYGTIASSISDSTQKKVFTGSATWVTADSKNAGTYTVDTENTQYKYYYSTGLSADDQAAEAAKWKHYAGGISADAQVAAASAGYVFNGWKATYYTTCESSKITPNPNNYKYNFATTHGSVANYVAGNQVPLHTHVVLVAQWKKIDTCTLTVKKLTVNETNADREFEFHLEFSNAGAMPTIPYIKGNEKGTISSDIGKYDFNLKKDQSIVFTFPKGTIYNLWEEDYTADGYVTTYAGSPAGTLNSNASATITNTKQNATLTVKKVVEAPEEQNLSTVQYPVTITIAETLYSGSAKLNGTATTINNGAIGLKPDDILVIEGLAPGGSYSVVEDLASVEAPEGYEYVAPTYEVDSAEAIATAPNNKILGEANTVVITNKLECRLGSLKITKTGLEEIDAYSSTMFHVTGGKGLDMTVAIHGNHSVTIKDLPYGTYKVEELTDWSWRYSSSSVPADGKVVLDSPLKEITFNNTRNKKQWLDSDCYAENTFDGSSAADRRPPKD